jgi:hypothetical protein
MIPAQDTAVVTLHLSKMTCGSCATTARIFAGIPARLRTGWVLNCVRLAQIAEHLVHRLPVIPLGGHRVRGR